MHTEQLKATKRVAMTKGGNRTLRASGYASAVLYGKKLDPILLSVSIHDFTQIITKSRSKDHSLIKLNVEGDKYTTLIRDIQFDPVTDVVEHIDFLNIPEGYKTKFKLSVDYVGTPVGQSYGGIFSTMIRELTLQGDPLLAPDSIEINVEDMGVGSTRHIRDIKVDGFEILEEDRRTVCSVVPPKLTGISLTEEDEEEGESQSEETAE